MAAQVSRTFTIMGSSFLPGAGGLIDRLKPNQMLAFKREPTNQHHANAVLVMWGERKLGWLPRQLADTIAPLMDAGVQVIVRKSPPIKGFGAYRGILELAYIPPDPVGTAEAPATEEAPNATKPNAGPAGEP